MANGRVGQMLVVTAAGATLRNLHALALGGLEADRARWFLWSPVCFGIGIAAYFAAPNEPSLGLACVSVVLAAALRQALKDHLLGNVLAIALLLVALGFAAAKLRALSVAAPVLDQRLRHVVVSGIVERVEPRTELGPRVTLRVLAIEGGGDRTPVRVRVRFLLAGTVVRPGDAVRIDAALSPPPPPALPGGYDFARAAYFNRIGAVGYARGPPTRIEPPPVMPPLMRAAAVVQQLRQWLGERIVAALPGQTGAIANALMTGERGRISRATLDAYRDAGLLHILSISGLHMAIMGGSVFFALRLALATVPALALRAPIKKWAAGGAILGSLAYLLVSGSTYATIRAFVMISIMMLAIILDRPAIALRNVAIAAMCILVVTPESLLHAGFQMSFAAVVALVAAYEGVRERRQSTQGGGPRSLPAAVLWFMVGVVGSTIVASLAVTPFAAYHFHKSQQYAVLANLIAVPVCNFIVLPAALVSYLAMPLGFDWAPLQVMGAGIDMMSWTAMQVAALPGAVARIPAYTAVGFGLIVCGGLWLCLWRTRWRYGGVFAIALGLAAAPLRERPAVLIGRDGHLVAVRQSDGRLAALANARAEFQLSRWLEHNGEADNMRSVITQRAYRCDQVGCVTRSRAGLRIAISKRPASLIDDCTRADVLVLRYRKPASCRSHGLVIDQRALRLGGTHAIYLSNDGQPVLRTVAGSRGNRPWTQSSARSSLQPRRRRTTRRPRPNRARAPSRLSGFAARHSLQGAGNRSRHRPKATGASKSTEP